MRNLTSAIAVLLSAVTVLARAPLHRRVAIPPPLEDLGSDELSLPEAKYIMTPLPTLLAYSGVSFFALYLLVILRRRCKIRVTGRRLTFGRANTRMGALELDGSEVELLPTVAEPGVREVRLPLQTVLDDGRSEEVSDDITGELVKPADAPSMPLIPLSTLGQLPPPSPFSPPSSPLPAYAHPSPMHPSPPYSLHDKDPVSPYASPPSRSVGLPLSLPLIPSTPIRQSRLGSPRPSVSKSRSSPGFNSARFATYPQRSKSSPPLPRRTKLGHEKSYSHSSSSDGAEVITLQPIRRVVSPSPHSDKPTHGFTLLSPPHIALSRSKSTGSDLIDLTTPSITPNASMGSLVRVARVETESATTMDTKDVVKDVPSVVPSVVNKDNVLTPSGEGPVKEEDDRRSEVDLVDLRFRASPSAPEAIALSLSGSSTSPTTVAEAPRPASLVVDDAPVSASQSTGSMSTDSSSSSSPSSPSMELFVAHSAHSTPGTTPMRPEFMFAGQVHAEATHEQTVGWEGKPEKETKAVSGWTPELPSFSSGASVDWYDHSDVWGSPSPAPPLPPVFTREGEYQGADEIQLMAFEEGSAPEMKVGGTSAGEDTVVGEDLINFEDETEEKGMSAHVVEVAAMGEVVENVVEGEVVVLQDTEVSIPETLGVSAVLTNLPANEHEDAEKENGEVDKTLFAQAHDDNNDDAHDFYDNKHDESTFNTSSLLQADVQEELANEDEDVFAARKMEEGDVDFVNEDEHPDPDLLPLPLDVPLPMSPAGRFYLELVRSASAAGREESAMSSTINSPQLLPALVISAPTPSRPRTSNSGLCMTDVEKPSGDDVKAPSPSPSPTQSRLPTPLQTPTPPSSPPPLVSPARRSPLAGLPVVTKPEVVEVKIPEASEGEVRDKENRLPAWSVRAADAPPLGLSSGNFTLKEKRSFNSRPKLSPVEAQARPLGSAPQSAEGLDDEPTTYPSAPSPPETQDIKRPEAASLVLGEKPIAPEPIQLRRSLPGSFDDSHEASTSQPLSTSESPESVATPPPKPAEVARPRQPRPIRSAIDIALAMQLRPGIGIGADPAWMVRFLMSMFGWLAVLISGSGEMDALLVGRR
ncbi:hypothetical protein BDN71DRAFT_1588274 [Pleurotus eryngii]|uniref:Uncharacterized protein n=1 Tax=Pleurotus eryngii TaxID=5323 RepID=A0A9P6A0H1_PLEER|nr:hypothetical protein BDN71DRAFT_1588274 [Pleurotus eryngii]